MHAVPCTLRDSHWAPAAPHTCLRSCHSADGEIGLGQEKDVLRATTQVAELGLSLQACPPSCLVGEDSPLGSCFKVRAPLLPHPACAGLGWGGQSRLEGS